MNKARPLAFVLLLIGFSTVRPLEAQSTVKRGLESMDFRPETEGEGLLGPKVSQKDAFYALRPPIGWKKKSYKGADKSLQFPFTFQDPKSADTLTIGLLQGGPDVLTLESLSRFRGDYLGAVRKKGVGKIIGTDMFRFRNYVCLQLLAERGRNVVLQLLVFDQPGSFLQLAYSLDKDHYHSQARALEASIASLEWPSFPDK